jgi:putative hemolysin
MKSVSKPQLLFSGILIFACATALAIGEGPGRRVCRIQGGTPWDVRLDDDQITLCRFEGLGVDVETFYNQVEGSQSPEAVRAFLAQSNHGPSSSKVACEACGGSYFSATDLESVPAALCQFPDGSRIEARALSVGSGPGEGFALARALQH